jgi:hypothetical protein
LQSASAARDTKVSYKLDDESMPRLFSLQTAGKAAEGVGPAASEVCPAASQSQQSQERQ